MLSVGVFGGPRAMGWMGGGASEGCAGMCVVTVDALAAVAGPGTEYAWKGSGSGSRE